jgi:hypothetical protein
MSNVDQTVFPKGVTLTQLHEMPGFAGRTQFVLGEEFSQVLKNGDIVTVPKGYVTDGASIPRIFWSTFIGGPFSSTALWAALTHDWRYDVNRREVALDYLIPGDSRAFALKMEECERNSTKAEVDKDFYDGLRAAGLGRIRSSLMYLAVRIGGSWNRRG